MGNTFPAALSLPLEPGPEKGERVIAVFDNLLPDSYAVRRMVATGLPESVATDVLDPILSAGRRRRAMIYDFLENRRGLAKGP